MNTVNPSFWSGKTVFLTGHTGFKGGWLVVWLELMGAKVVGYAREPVSAPNLFSVAGISGLCDRSVIGEITDAVMLQSELAKALPDIVIHMAAQSLVRYSYLNPVETYSTNIMGTVTLLDAVRSVDSIRAVLIITSDKCYENLERQDGYTEVDPMGGYDPYSSSKGCAELVTAAYRQSFFSEINFSHHKVAIASCRAGNVIGGGDWSKDRLIPDALKAFASNSPLVVRNPNSIRPWQHVLEPLSGYLVLAQSLFENGITFSGAWNFGPNMRDARTVKEVVELLISKWGSTASWMLDGVGQPHEAHYLRLNCTKANQLLGWNPKWSLEEAIAAIVEWHEVYKNKRGVLDVCRHQIHTYLEG